MGKKDLGHSLTFGGSINKAAKAFEFTLARSRSAGPESIHRLRVSIKKLRSLLLLVEKIEGKKIQRKRIFRLLDPVYDSAGMIRTVHVNAALMKKYSVSTSGEFIAYLKTESKRLSRDLTDAFNGVKNKEIHQLLLKAAETIDGHSLKAVSRKTDAFIKEETDEIKRLLWAQPAPARLHWIRKKLKSIKTVASTLEEIESKKKWKKISKKAGRAEKQIGDWHDRDVLLVQLKDFMRRTQRPGRLKQVHSSLRKRNKKEMKRIVKHLRETFD